MPDWLYWTILVVVTLPLDFLAAWGIFDDWDGFVEAFWYMLKPDILSWIQGELADDLFSEIKFMLWLGMCVGLVFLANFVTQTYIVG